MITFRLLVLELNDYMYVIGWGATTGDPDDGLNIFHTRAFGAPGNRTFLSDPEVDRLIDAARMEINPVVREQMYIDAQKIIHAQAPWLYLLENEHLIAARNNVKGFVINPAGHQPLWTIYFE